MKKTLLALCLLAVGGSACADETFQCGKFEVSVDVTNSFMVNGAYHNTGTSYITEGNNVLAAVKLEDAMTSIQSSEGYTEENIILKDHTFIINRGFIGNSGNFSNGAFTLVGFNTGNINCSNQSGHTEL